MFPPASTSARLFVFALVLLGIASPRHAVGAEPSVSVYDSLAVLRPDRPAPNGARTEAVISSAQNEAESFQLLVSAEANSVNGLSVTPGAPLVSAAGDKLPSSALAVYREGYYQVTQRSDAEGGTGRWPDVLIPAVDSIYGEARNAFPVNVPAGGQVAVWVDVLVPDEQPAGEYSGSLAVRGAGSRTVEVPVRLTVEDFSLPSTSTLKSAFFDSTEAICSAFTGSADCKGNQEKAWELQSTFAVVGLNNRITIANAYAGPPTSSYFGRYMAPLLQGTDPRVLLRGARLTSVEAYWRYCAVSGSSCLSNWRKAAEQYDFADRFFLYVCDEPSDASAWNQCKQTAQIADQQWPGVRKLITGSIADAESQGATASASILAPVINYIDSPASGSQRASYNGFVGGGNDVWLYTSCMSYSCDSSEGSYWNGWPGYAIDQPASQARAMGWMAFLYDAGGELYYDTTVSLPTASTNQYIAGGNGDGNLFYAGTASGANGSVEIGGTRDIPLESIRLKRIRDSREDYEYLRLASESDADAVTALARGLFGGPGGTPAKQATVTYDSLNWARASAASLITGRPVPASTPRPTPTPAAPEPEEGQESQGSPDGLTPVSTDVEGENDLRLRVLRIKVPRSVAQLRRRGVRALVRCSVDCRVEVGSEVSLGVARRLGLAKTQISRGSIELAANRRGWITAKLSRAVRARLAKSHGGVRLRTKFNSSPA